MPNSIRKPSFAGTFYPGEPEELRKTVANFIERADIPGKPIRDGISFVAPHAGYIYSGQTAGFTYKALALRLFHAPPVSTFVLLGPNHTGYGGPLSLSGKDWSMPTGMARNDREFTNKLLAYSSSFSIDESAHEEEHSIEVQLPFVLSLMGEPRCVFLCMGDQSYESSLLVSKAIANAERQLKRNIVVIASSDFNHYESAAIAKQKDLPAIDTLCSRFDPKEFSETIKRLDDSACGYGPITAAALYAKSGKEAEGHLLNYSNSGKAMKDYTSVVAYASMVFV